MTLTPYCFYDLVGVVVLAGDLQVVGEAGAATALDGDANADVVGIAFLLCKVPDFFGGLLGDFHRQFHAVSGDRHITLQGCGVPYHTALPPMEADNAIVGCRGNSVKAKLASELDVLRLGNDADVLVATSAEADEDDAVL